MKQSLLFVIVLCACGPMGPGVVPPDAGPGVHQASARLRACAAATDGSQLDNAAQLSARINALPAPVDPACVVAGLPRPLSIVATTSAMSAQPADGPKSPRIFILGPAMVLSVVPSGLGAKLIETGEWVTGTRTIKGELDLPPAGMLASDAAYTKVAQSNQTSTCALCHRAEAEHPSLPGAYVSAAYRPNPGEEVSLAKVTALHDECVAMNDEGPRCELLHAMFDFGAVRQGAFRREVALFIE